MISRCCKHTPIAVDGELSYYACSHCGAPCDRLVIVATDGDSYDTGDDRKTTQVASRT